MVSVLVVDDDPAIGRLLALILATENIDVDRVESGRAALSYLQDEEGEPDLILLDLSMPEMDGREVFREVRRSGVTCPIVFCSAYGAESTNKELGGQGAINKPFNPESLIKSIKAFTDKTGTSNDTGPH